MAANESYVIVTHSTGETKALARDLASALIAGDVISLTGDLGAGKTVFVQGLAEGLGIKERVTSPTFTIIKEYAGRIPMFHMDVYRLSSPAELVDLGYEEYFFGEGVSIVEWGDRVEALFPPDYLEISIDRLAESDRKLALAPHGSRWIDIAKSMIGGSGR